MTLKLATSIGINSGTFGSKACDFILQIYYFCGIHIVFEYFFNAIDLED